jgi:hypothetical protein
VEEKKVGILTKGNPVVPKQSGRTIGKFLRWRISQEFLVGNKGIRHILQPEHGNKAKKNRKGICPIRPVSTQEKFPRTENFPKISF